MNETVARVPEPEWVILGYRASVDAVVVVGSTDLIRAELQAVFDQVEVRDLIMHYQVPHLVYTELRGQMRSYSYVMSRNYAEALRLLFGQGFDPDQKPAVTANRMEISP